MTIIKVRRHLRLVCVQLWPDQHARFQLWRAHPLACGCGRAPARSLLLFLGLCEDGFADVGRRGSKIDDSGGWECLRSIPNAINFPADQGDDEGLRGWPDLGVVLTLAGAWSSVGW